MQSTSQCSYSAFPSSFSFLNSSLSSASSSSSVLKSSNGVKWPPKTLSGWQKLGFKVFGRRFAVKQSPDNLLGRGSFGEVWKCFDAETNKDIALKLQIVDESVKVKIKIARNESRILSNISGRGIPKVFGYGKYQSNDGILYYYTAMTLLGPNLNLLSKQFNRSFTVPTVCLLTLQMLDRIQTIHSRGLLHRDIKPDNFVFGDPRTDPDVLYLCDFGFAKCYYGDNGNHIPFVKTGVFLGTPSYASLNVHQGLESSRRDDLESMMYVVLWLLKGRLPWSGLKGKLKTKDKNNLRDAIYREKRDLKIGQLFYGQSDEWCQMMIHIRNLEFSAEPDYELLKNLIFSVLNRYPEHDRIYDWLRQRSLISVDSSMSTAMDTNSDSGGGLSTSELTKTLAVAPLNQFRNYEIPQEPKSKPSVKRATEIMRSHIKPTQTSQTAQTNNKNGSTQLTISSTIFH
jgi:serine/threonine protein kinase